MADLSNRQLFTSEPTGSCRSKISNVTDAVDVLQAFDALYQANPETSGYTKCGDEPAANWFMGEVRREILNCGGRKIDFNIFEEINGGPFNIQEIPAKEYTIMSQCGVDFNIYAQSAPAQTGAGNEVTFQLLRELHNGGGKYNPLAEGNDLYIYEDGQSVTVTNIDKDNDYGHLITVIPKNGNYNVNIRANAKMLVIPARNEGAISCAKPEGRWFTPGYQNTIRPYKNRVDWELPLDIMTGYKGVMRFALILDANGMEQECWIPKAREDARWAMNVRKNLEFYLGQKITNPDHPLFATEGGSGNYTGFEGYRSTLQYGGGTVFDFDPSTGFDLQTDYENIVRTNDAIKRSSEYLVIAGRNFMVGLDRNNNGYLKNSSITFETFRRSGLDEGAIKKLGITSYEYRGQSLHFKQSDVMTDSRFVGNGDIANEAYFMPGDGITDSNGNSVPAIEMYMPSGCGKSAGYGGKLEDWMVDYRKNSEKRCEKIGGSITETVMMGINCPNLHILANPVKACTA